MDLTCTNVTNSSVNGGKIGCYIAGLTTETIPIKNAFDATFGEGDYDSYLTRIMITEGDIDADGMNNSYEIEMGLGPDRHGLTNLEEYILGTKSNRGDSDWDGITDNINYNPTFFTNSRG